MLRSERRSYHSLRFKNTESHHELHKPPLTYDSQVVDTAVYEVLKAKNKGALVDQKGGGLDMIYD